MDGKRWWLTAVAAAMAVLMVAGSIGLAAGACVAAAIGAGVLGYRFYRARHPATGPVVLTVGGVASNGVTFTVLPTPVIASVSPTTAAGGVQVVVTGSAFGQTQGSSALLLGTSPATVVSWSDAQIVATVASNARSGNAEVQRGGIWSNTVPFTVISAAITSVTPASGLPGDSVTIAGSGFGASQG